MVVDHFSTLGELESVRARWRELYEIDSQASLFLSWEWMDACLATERKRWIVLGVRDEEGPYLAFLPLSAQRFPVVGPALTRELSLAGSPRADFAGMLGVAGEEHRYIPALAREIEALKWDRFSVKNCDDRRMVALVNEFSHDRYRIERGETTPCPFIELPVTWEEYLESRGKSTRRTIRSHLRKIEALPGYHLDFPKSEEGEEAIEMLLRVSSLRLKRHLREWRRVFGGLFSRCYASGRFQVAAMYQGQTLMAAQGFFLDRNRRAIVAYMIGHNPEYAKYSPGVMLGCASIRRAIEEGYRRYDLARGDQGYKMSLATGVKDTTSTTLWRRDTRGTALFMGRQSISAAKELARHVLVSRPAG